MSKGIYPGSFDPFTLGHKDIVLRALNVVETLVVAVVSNFSKKTLFSLEERVDLIKADLADLPPSLFSRIEVKSFEGLLVNFAKNENCFTIIRGLRAVSDFEYEFQMSCMNSKLDDKIQTIFLPASEKMQLISSKLVKEVIYYGGNVKDFVTDKTASAILNKYK